MDRLQHLLCKLSEECQEVGQIALKSSYFGLEEVYTEGGFIANNAERTHIELDDVMAVIQMLNEEYNFGYVPNQERINIKKKKINKYADYSSVLGLLK